MTNEQQQASPDGAGDPGSAKKRYAAKPKKKGWRRLFTPKALLLWFLGFVALAFAGVGAAFALIEVPDPNDFSTSEASIVYYADGETELGRFNEENRQIVSADEIPDSVKLAVVAAEDRSFYENPGFDIAGIARAARDAVTGGGSGGGGSTITQQYVKNYYLTQDREITRKLREIVIAVKVDQAQDKDQIVADYLNTIWFGRGTYGVQTAAQSYFGVDVAEVDLAQSVALAAILRSPARYDPTLSEENAQRFAERFDYVLDGLVEIGALDQASADAVQPPEILPEQRSNRYGGPQGYLLQMVREELIARGFDEAEIETGGLRVVSTFDKQAQDAMIAAVDEERPTENADRVRIGAASVRPGDGAVVAIYGGPDAVDQPTNDAVDSTVQIGSTAKPFALAALLANGYSLTSTFAGNSPLEDPVLGPPVNNQGNADYGRYTTLLTATKKSVNTAYVDATMEVGANTVIETMIDAGLPESALTAPDAPEIPNNPRIAIGIAQMSALDVAEGYATFAAQGVHADPYVVAEVTDRNGTARYTHESTAEETIDADVAADVTYALEQTVVGGTADEAQRLERPVAGKTGTHEQLTSWFAGYTPQLATAVAFFRGDETSVGTEPLTDVGGVDGTFTGGGYPARLFTTYMIGALEGQPEEDFPEPAWIDAESRSRGNNGNGGSNNNGGGNNGNGRGRDDDDDSDEPDETSPPETDEPDPTRPPETDEPEPPPSPEPPPGDDTGGEWGGGDEGGGEGGTESGGDESGGTESGGDDSGGTESGGDATGGTDSGGDTGTDAGSDSGTDAGSDTGTDSGADTGTTAALVP